VRQTLDMRRQALGALILLIAFLLAGASAFYVWLIRVERDLSDREEVVCLSGPPVVFIVGAFLWTSGWLRAGRAS
jgi:hypothetical protein